MISNLRRSLVGTLAVSPMFPHLARAQAPFPAKPVVLVVPTAPGGAWDIMGRVLAQRITQSLGTAFIVENKGGAGTTIGAHAVAVAAPDAYSLLIAGTATLALAPALVKTLPYDPIKNFTTVSLLSTHSYTLMGRPGLKANSLSELIVLGKSGNGLTVATSGAGTGQHVAALLLAQVTGARFTYVPYKGAGAVYPDLIADRVDLFFDTTSVAASQIKSGQVKAFMVSSPSRSPLLPQVPTPAEAGLPGFEMEGWLGVFAPKGIQVEPLEYLRRAIDSVRSSPDFVAAVEKAGGRIFTLSDQQREGFVAAEVARWGKILRDSGIEPQ